MLNYNLYELKEIKSLRDLQKNQEEVKKDLFLMLLLKLHLENSLMK